MEEKWIQNYDRYPIQKIAYKKMLSFIPQQLNSSPGGSILDVGCGTGELERILRKNGFDGMYIGVDSSEQMIAQAKAKVNVQDSTRSQFIVADAENLPFDRDSIDAVVCAFSLHHFWQPDQAVKEIRRVLKPSGNFILMDILNEGVWGKWAHWFEKYIGDGYGLFTAQQLEIFLKLGDFEVTKKKQKLISSWLLH